MFYLIFFGWPHYHKISDFFSDYKGHKPPGIDSPLLSHQQVKGGLVDFDGYVSLFSFLKNAVEVSEFETEFMKVDRYSKYWLVLSDSNEILLETQEPSLK